MRYHYVIGPSSASLLLCITMSACDKVNIPENKDALPGAGQALQSIAYSFRIPPSLAAKLGNDIYDREIDRRKRETDHNVTEQMRRIFERLKDAALTDQTYGSVAKDMDWRLNTIRENDIVMAKAYPGGGIAIYEGVFPIAENEGALAAILGHELAHVLARHELKRLTGDVAEAAMTLGPAIASGTSPAKMDPKIIGPVAGALGVGYTVGIRQPWQQAQELEADCLGLLLAAKAGYDPEIVAGFWQRMAVAAKTQGANDRYQFLNDHPINEDRVAYIKNTCLSPAQRVYNQVESTKRQNASAMLPDVIAFDGDNTGILFPKPDDVKQYLGGQN